MEKSIYDKILDSLGDRSNWLIFSVVLSVTTIYFIDKIHEDLWSWHLFWYIIPYFNFNPTHLLFEDGKNLTFLVSEILLTSMALTRVLIAFDILHIIQRTPIVADVINFCWKERRKEIEFFQTKYLMPCVIDYSEKCIDTRIDMKTLWKTLYCNKYGYGESGIYITNCFPFPSNRDDPYYSAMTNDRKLREQQASTIWFKKLSYHGIKIDEKTQKTIYPIEIHRFLDRKFYGYFLCNKPLFKIKNREIKLGDIYALFAMLFAIYTIYVV